MRYIFILLCFLTLSCGFKQWKSKGLEKGWLSSDTVYRNIITNNVSKDTVFHNSKDTVVIHKDKLTVKYFYNPIDCTNYLAGQCAPDTIRVEKVINNILEGKDSDKWVYLAIIAALVALLVILKR